MGGGVGEQLWRAVAVFRLATLVYAAALVVANHDHYARPRLGWLLLAVMVAWTAAMVAAGRRPGGPPRALLAADVAGAAGGGGAAPRRGTRPAVRPRGPGPPGV